MLLNPIILKNRFLGSYSSNDSKENLAIFLAAIHGNEQSGILALQRVFNVLNKQNIQSNGKVIGLAGNLAAIKEFQRYIDEDLNRMWTKKRIQSIKKNGTKNAEETELLKILTQIESYNYTEYKNRYFIDLHATSSSKGVFAITTKEKECIDITSKIHVPIILGLEKSLVGTTHKYMMDQNGFLSVAFEGGKLSELSSVDLHEAGVWAFLVSTGIVMKEDVPEYERFETVLKQSDRLMAPKVSEVKYVYKIKEGEEFKMVPGFKNFQRITKGQVLAHNKTDAIKSPMDGFMLMPLYQKQGEEGFFIVNTVS